MNFLIYISPMNCRYEPKVDQFINDLLDAKPELVKKDRFSAYLKVENKTFQIWTANRWYAYAARGGNEYDHNKYWSCLRPKRSTMLRLYEYLKPLRDEEVPTLAEALKEKDD
jgi:hypothetical protein